MTSAATVGTIVDLSRHPLADPAYAQRCRAELAEHGVLLLKGFLRPEAVDALVAEAEQLRDLAFYSSQTHNVYLDPPDPARPHDDARSRVIISTKGAVTTDQLPTDSGLRHVYDSQEFRAFLAAVLGVPQLHEYADPLSSINMNYYNPGQELGWHFDNSTFSVTLLVQQPDCGGVFEFITDMRNTATGDQNERGVTLALDGNGGRRVVSLDQQAGDLALFRGRDALHRVTPVDGNRTRLLVVFAYNTEPGLSLSPNARLTFFGRLG